MRGIIYYYSRHIPAGSIRARARYAPPHNVPYSRSGRDNRLVSRVRGKGGRSSGAGVRQVANRHQRQVSSISPLDCLACRCHVIPPSPPAPWRRVVEAAVARRVPSSSETGEGR